MTRGGKRQPIGAVPTMIMIGVPIDRDALRLRAEFLAMPGLRLTLPQTMRLLDIGAAHAASILDTLVGEGFLMRDDDGYRYRPGTSLASWTQ